MPSRDSALLPEEIFAQNEAEAATEDSPSRWIDHRIFPFLLFEVLEILRRYLGCKELEEPGMADGTIGKTVFDLIKPLTGVGCVFQWVEGRIDNDAKRPPVVAPQRYLSLEGFQMTARETAGQSRRT